MDFTDPWSTLLWCKEFWLLEFETWISRNHIKKVFIVPIWQIKKKVKYDVQVHANIKWHSLDIHPSKSGFNSLNYIILNYLIY